MKYLFEWDYRNQLILVRDSTLFAAFGPIRDHFHSKQHQLTATRYRQELRQQFQDWREAAGLKSAA
ncbi:MAG: hypothetical protein KME10_26525 [Plectolyngbya sp. WJT66-NPBG17]|nr:hypothetical protein [Plectolyngbya sp. WJT66-NPBG17]